MNQRALIQLHGFTAVFFLPLVILYGITGIVYILGESGYTDDRVLEVGDGFGWPATQEAAFAAVNEVLEKNNLPVIAEVAGKRSNENAYHWLGVGHRVTVTRNDAGLVEIRTSENSLLRQMVEIHKNHAGVLFTVLGIAFGIAMLLLVASGAYMMFASRLYRRDALVALGSGVALTVIAYVVSV